MEENRTLFGKYQVGRILGKGNFAKVFHAKNISTSESVAIKVINKEQVKKPHMVEQVRREISVMGRVRHPNVVELREVMATRTKIFLVMEYVRGGELFAKVSKGKLNEDLARKYFQQLISAVDFCHSRGVYHRDIKPENLLLDENGNLKVSDFGLSALPENCRHDGLLHTQCGTPEYVAPEVLRKKGYDGAKADVWSCGVVLYLLLAGCLPFKEENVIKMYRKICRVQFEFPPWFSAYSKEFISKLLVADPERRISIQEIILNPWFLQKISFPEAVALPGDIEEEETDKNTKTSSAKFFNAFQLISSMSSGLDLSNLFENTRRPGSIFTSKCSVTAIMAKIEGIANGLRFKVGKPKDLKLRLHSPTEGQKGRLSVTAEVFEVAPEVAVVEMMKLSGDTLEYCRFCEEDVRPALKDIVWTWQGDSVSNGKVEVARESLE